MMPTDDDILREEGIGYLRIKAGDKEIELRGTQEMLDKHAMWFYSMLRPGNEVDLSSLPATVDGDITVINASDLDENEESGKDTETLTDLPDLISFFLEKSPGSQRDEVLVITYYYHHYRNQQYLSLKDYEDAYAALKKAAVKTPRIMKSSVRNVVDRTPYLFNPESGKFELTIQGKRFVEDMKASSDFSVSERS